MLRFFRRPRRGARTRVPPGLLRDVGLAHLPEILPRAEGTKTYL